jgi:hypothetical protein
MVAMPSAAPRATSAITATRRAAPASLTLRQFRFRATPGRGRAETTVPTEPACRRASHASFARAAKPNVVTSAATRVAAIKKLSVSGHTTATATPAACPSTPIRGTNGSVRNGQHLGARRRLESARHNWPRVLTRARSEIPSRRRNPGIFRRVRWQDPRQERGMGRPFRQGVEVQIDSMVLLTRLRNCRSLLVCRRSAGAATTWTR